MVIVACGQVIYLARKDERQVQLRRALRARDASLAADVLMSGGVFGLFEPLLDGRMPDDSTRLSALELASLRWDPKKGCQ